MSNNSSDLTFGGPLRRDYEVGYGKPPMDKQFKQGQSGNPKGRPKGARNWATGSAALNEEPLKAMVLREAHRKITIRDGNRMVKMPVLQAVVRGLGLRAAKGEPGAQRRFLDLYQGIERAAQAMRERWIDIALDYKAGWQRALERCRKSGEPMPDPVPHPDDIVVDFETGRVEIRGPLTRKEKVKWDEARAFKADHDAFLAEIEAEAARRPKNKGLSAMLAQHRAIGASIRTALRE